MRWIAPCLAALVCLCLALPTPSSLANEKEEMPAFPNLTLLSRDGSQTSLEDFKGRPVLINFWASWCGPCRMELPELQTLYNEYAAKGFVLVTINTDRQIKAMDQFIRVTGLAVPVYRLEPAEEAILGIRSLPTSLLLGPDFVPVQMYEGYSPSMVMDIRQRLQELLDED